MAMGLSAHVPGSAGDTAICRDGEERTVKVQPAHPYGERQLFPVPLHTRLILRFVRSQHGMKPF